MEPIRAPARGQRASDVVLLDLAFGDVFRHGGHFVPLNPATKRPARKGWNTCRRPHPADIREYAHEGNLGIIPASVDMIVVDVDKGDPDALWSHAGQPFAELKTRRGVHGCFDAHPEVAGYPVPYETEWASGEIRWKGFCKLHPGGLVQLAEALNTRTRASAPLQLDAFDVLRVEVPPVIVRRSKAPVAAREAETPVRRVIVPPIKLEAVQPGNRRNALWNNLAYWTHRQNRGTNYEAWLDRCRDRAVRECRRFPDLDEFTVEEARQLGYYTGKWAWENIAKRPGHSYDHSTEAQARRGRKSGKVRRKIMEYRRDRARQLADKGWTQKAIAMELGVTPRSVRSYLNG